MESLIQLIQFRIEELQEKLVKAKDRKEKEFIEKTISTNLKLLKAIKPIGRQH